MEKMILQYRKKMNDILFEISKYLDFYGWSRFVCISKHAVELLVRELDKENHIQMTSAGDISKKVFVSMEVTPELYPTLDFHNPCFRYIRDIEISFAWASVWGSGFRSTSIPTHLDLRSIIANGCKSNDNLYDTDIELIRLAEIGKLPRNVSDVWLAYDHDFHYIKHKIRHLGCCVSSPNIPFCNVLNIWSYTTTSEEEFYELKNKVSDTFIISSTNYASILGCDFGGPKAIVIAPLGGDPIRTRANELIEILREIYGEEKTTTFADVKKGGLNGLYVIRK
jgi:hypothetical protein